MSNWRYKNLYITQKWRICFFLVTSNIVLLFSMPFLRTIFAWFSTTILSNIRYEPMFFAILMVAMTDMFLALFWKSIIAVAVLIIAAITKCFASIFSISVREPFMVTCPITQLFMHPLAHHCVLVFAFWNMDQLFL